MINEIRKELKKHASAQTRESAQRFFKGELKLHGVKTPVVRKIARDHFPKDLSKKELFALCERLLESRMAEETTIAFQWAFRIKKHYDPADFARFERWVKKYVTNWAYCDDFCTHAFGYLLTAYPQLVKKTIPWRTSKNRWLRRAAAVILIYPTRKKGKPYLKDVWDTADTLLTDADDLVQKGYGWMLKEASNQFPTDVYKFVMKRKDRMPRTALRYAIEKYPKEMRTEAMKTKKHSRE